MKWFDSHFFAQNQNAHLESLFTEFVGQLDHFLPRLMWVRNTVALKSELNFRLGKKPGSNAFKTRTRFSILEAWFPIYLVNFTIIYLSLCGQLRWNLSEISFPNARVVSPFEVRIRIGILKECLSNLLVSFAIVFSVYCLLCKSFAFLWFHKGL